MEKSTIEIIKKGEGLTIEFKRKIDSVFKIARTIASFANTSGGVLLIGVDDDGRVVGIESEMRELQKLERVAALVDAPISVVFRKEIIDAKIVLRIEIEESQEKPHYAVNERNQRLIYIRVKDKSVPTPKLLLRAEADQDFSKLVDSRPVKTLIHFLKENDSIHAKTYARMINVSEKRSERMLHDLAGRQVLLKRLIGKQEVYSLKWTD